VDYVSLQKSAAPGGIRPKRMGIAHERHILQKKQIACQVSNGCADTEYVDSQKHEAPSVRTVTI
jgi:hypothetical protein